MKVHNYIKKIAFLGLISAIVYAGVAVAAEKYSPVMTISTVKSSGASADAASGKSASSSIITPLMNFDTQGTYEESGVFAGSEKEIAELKKLEPIVENLQKAVDAHNTLNGLKHYYDTEKRYQEMQLLHQKSIEVLKGSEQCVVNFIGRYFDNPVRVWSGIDLRQNPQNHDLRKGLSKWAVDAFETAKSAQLSPIVNDDVSAMNSETIELTNKNSDELTEDNYAANKDSKLDLDIAGKQSEMRSFSDSHNGVFFKDPSKQSQYEEDSRKTDVLPLDIGTEASLLLAKEPKKWGSVKKIFPVWNDQKVFYNQYLNGKYHNIEDFIRNLDISAEMRTKIYNALSEDQEKFMSQAEKDIMYAAKKSKEKVERWYEEEYQAAEKTYNDEVAAIIAKAKAQTNELKSAMNSKVSSIQREIDSSQNTRSGYAVKIDDLNRIIQSLDKESANTTAEISKYEGALNSSSLTPEQQEEQKALKKEMEDLLASNQTKINELKKERDTTQAAYDKESKAIEDKEKEKATVRTDYNAQISEVDKLALDAREVLKKDFDDKVAKLKDERDSKIDKISISAEAAKLTMSINSKITVNQINNTTTLIVGLAKKDATDNVAKTRDILDLLGDDLYRGHPSVMGYHNALIKSLKGEDATFEALSLEGVSAKVPGITTKLLSIISGKDLEENLKAVDENFVRSEIKNSKIVLKVSIFDKVLSKIDANADNEYFVGATPKDRDFKAPKAMPDFNLPPVREYVRFDYIDLKNATANAEKMVVGQDIVEKITILGKLSEIKRFVPTEPTPLTVIDKKTFLSYGGRIPEIWTLMLKDKAFVERDFYLTKEQAQEDANVTVDALKLGGEGSALFRGGIYPCVVENIKRGTNVCNIKNMIENGQGYLGASVKTYGKINKNEHTLGLGFIAGAERIKLVGQNLPICQGISAYCRNSGNDLGKINIPVLVTGKGAVDALLGTLGEAPASELGTVLSLNSGKIGSRRVYNLLTLTPEMESVLRYGSRMEDEAKKDNVPEFNAEQKLNDTLYNTAQYNNNQIGDYLVRVEQEQTYRNAVDELKETIAEMRQSLLKILKEIGFVPSADYDISKDSDYQLTISKLKGIKQAKMSTAQSNLSSIQDGGNEMLVESKKIYKHIYDSLLQDKDAVTLLSMNPSNMDNQDERVKSGKANNEVSGTYENVADKQFEEQLKSFTPPYCVAY